MEHLHSIRIRHRSLSIERVLVDDADRPTIIGLNHAKIQVMLAKHPSGTRLGVRRSFCVDMGSDRIWLRLGVSSVSL
jgi:hypothetical protein